MGLEQALEVAQRYLEQRPEPYKAELKYKRREGWLVWEFRLGGFEVWVDAQNGRVNYLRPRPIPPHARRPHLPFQQALSLARTLVPQVEKLELKPKEGLLIWEVRGGPQEIWLDAQSGRVLRRNP
ncbi:hypothetical protein DV704_08590 [Meiothermus sp. QL-1]|nr:hypothetical protein DV704_08590 [Meiothermus sp. QL-1]